MFNKLKRLKDQRDLKAIAKQMLREFIIPQLEENRKFNCNNPYFKVFIKRDEDGNLLCKHNFSNLFPIPKEYNKSEVIFKAVELAEQFGIEAEVSIHLPLSLSPSIVSFTLRKAND